MQFEFEHFAGKEKFDDCEIQEETFDIKYFVNRWWNPNIDKEILWPPQIKVDICNKLTLDDISPRRVCLDPKSSEHPTAMNDSSFYLMDPEEYNIPLDEIEYIYRDSSIAKKHEQDKAQKECTPYMFYTDSYITIKEICERRVKSSKTTTNDIDYFDGFLTRRVLKVKTTFISVTAHTTIEAPACFTQDGTKCYYMYETDPGDDKTTEIASNYMLYCLAFSL